MDIVITLVLILAGLFAIVASAFDRDFFMEDRKAEFFVKHLGRNGARGLYGGLGLVIVVIGVLELIDIVGIKSTSALVRSRSQAPSAIRTRPGPYAPGLCPATPVAHW